MFASPVYTIMAVAFFLAGVGVCRGTDEEDPLANVPFPELVIEFRELRKTKGHFDGGPWRNDVDRWMGRKHRVMEALRQAIDVRGFGRPQLAEQLGAPDRILDENDPMFHTFARDFNHSQKNHGPVEILVYHWRGGHDFLYFVAVDEMLIDSGWWHAGE